MRQQFFGLCLALFLTPLVTGALAQSTFREEGLHTARPGLFAIRGATIHVSGSEQIEGGTVVLLHDKILAVGKDLEIPAGAVVIDGSGKHVYAGLVDGYLGYTAEVPGLGEATANANSRITPQLQLSEVFKLDQLNAAERRAAGFTNALVAPTAGIIRGTSFIAHLSKTQSNRTVLAPNVAMQARLTLDRAFGPGGGGAGGGTGYPSSPMGAFALARQTLLDAQWYRDAWQAARIRPEVSRPDVNASLEALQPVLTGSLPLMVETTNELFVLRARRFADEFGLRLVVMGNGNEYRRLAEVVATRAPLVLPLDFPKAPKVSSPADVLDLSLETLMHWDHAPGNPGALVKAGATIAFTTQGLEKPGDWRSQIRRAIERGLDPGVALDAWTRVPAKLYGVDDQLGTVTAGKLANLVLSNGPLFEEKTKILETWVLGERFEHQPAALRAFPGIWHLKSDADPLMSLYLVVRDEGKISGAIRKSVEPNPDDPELELKGAETAGVRLSGSLEATKLGGTGTALMELVVDRPGEGLGSLAFSDGRSLKFQAVRVGEAEKAAPRGSRNRSEQGAEKEVASAAGETPPAEEKKPESVAPDSEAPAVAQTSEEKAAKPQIDEGSDPAKSKPAKADTAPLYGVNYPLGDFGREQVPVAAGRVLFVNATVWTCGPEGKLEGAAVLVEGGLIARIFKAGEALPPADLTIDAAGRHLTPGIIDCHSHMATDSGVNEGSQAITAEVRIGDFVDCDDLNIIRQLAGGVTTVNVLHGSANPIGGQNQVLKLRWGRNDEQMKFVEAPPGIKFALGENVKRSGSPQPSTRYPRSRMGVEQLMQDAFRAAKEYDARKAEYQRTRSGLPPRVDLELETLAEIVRGERWIHCHSYRQDEILALLRVLEEHQIRIGSLQHILEGYKVAEAMAKHGAMASAFSDWWAYKVEVYDAIPQAGALMHQQGIVVSFNSDDPELARHLNHEAAKAVRYGNVPEEEALKFVTLNPARQLRIEHLVGSIEPGKQADLALWSGHPLDTLSRCEQTWVDGIKYFDRIEQAELTKQQAEMKRQLVQKALGAKQTAGGVEAKVDPASLWLRHDEFCHGHAKDDGSGAQEDAEFLDLLLYQGDHTGHNHGDGSQRKPR
ncbi:MAG: amidohydrolase family protein [Planctomycetota bacterium]